MRQMTHVQRQGDWLFAVRPRTQADGDALPAHAGGGLISASEVSGHSHVATIGDGIAVSPTQVVLRPVGGQVNIAHLDAAGVPCGHDALLWVDVPDDSEVVGIRQIQVAPDGLVEVSKD